MVEKIEALDRMVNNSTLQARDFFLIYVSKVTLETQLKYNLSYIGILNMPRK